MTARHLPPPQNGSYRGPALVQPERSGRGVDLSEVATRERRERWTGDARPASTPWSRRFEWLAIAGILLALATIIVPGALWLLRGAEQSAVKPYLALDAERPPAAP